MKEKTNINNPILPFLISGIILLLLLSPCKVRNLIQDKVGVPKTEVSSKNKSTLNISTCGIFSAADAISTITTVSFHYAPVFLASHQDFYLIFPHLPTRSIALFNKSKEFVSAVPLYILYLNLKAYL